MILLLLFILGLIPSMATAACNGSGLSWSCTAGSTGAQINSAISSASDNAVITFAAGSYTGWDVSLDPAKGVTLQGAGIDASNVTCPANCIILWDSSASPATNSKKYRITGFTFTGGGGGNMIHISAAGGANPKTFTNIRIHNNRFNALTTGGVAIRFGTPEFKTFCGPCLVDHNTVTGPDQDWDFVHHVAGDGGMADRSGSIRGTNNNLFIEDNTISFDAINTIGIGTLDSHGAVGLVLRYNTITNAQIGSHGVTHGGTANYEVYRNTLARTAGAYATGYRMLMTQGSGELSWWGNTFNPTGTIDSAAMEIGHYRSTGGGDLPVGMNRCDGADSSDGNISGLSGWPCWMQPGRAPNSPGGIYGTTNKYGTLSPIYLHQNINSDTGALVNPAFVTTQHLAANRDYYNAASASAQSSASSPFSGISGTGYGTLANRPTTCSTGTDPESSGLGGVAYWATDQGEWNDTNGATPDGRLYRCTAGNTWVVAYTPYTYPHPLQEYAGGGARNHGITGKVRGSGKVRFSAP